MVDKPVILKVGPPLIEMWLTGVGQPIVNNDNGRGTDDTTEAAFDTDTTVQLYTWFQQMQQDGLLTIVPDTPGQVDQYFGMAQGTASMTIETSTAATTIEKFLGGDTSVASQVPGASVDTSNIDLSALDIGAGEVPGIEAARSPSDGRWRLVHDQHAATRGAGRGVGLHEVLQLRVESGHVEPARQLPALPHHLRSTRLPIQERWTTTLAGQWLAIAYDELLNGVDPNFPGPLLGPYDEFRVAIRKSVEQMVFNGRPPDDVVTQAATETTDALQRYQDENF